MPEIETIHPQAKQHKGVHLYHFAMSNCSQRARMALEEKGLSWESHHLNMMADEHATAEYQMINPNGVVPTLVHDGRTIIESVDIIDYVDGLSDRSPLRPTDPALAHEMQDFLALADGAQGAIKLLSHEFLFKPKRKMSQAQIDAFALEHRNPALVEFLREFSEGFSRERIATEVAHMDGVFDKMDQSLTEKGGPWLLGQHYSLADVAWIVNVHRLSLMRWNFKHWPGLNEWLGRMRQRPAYKTALADWEFKQVNRALGVYALFRSLTGSGVNSFR